MLLPGTYNSVLSAGLEFDILPGMANVSDQS